MSAHANALVEVLFTDPDTGYAAGKNSMGAVVLKTIDGGVNWTVIYNGSVPGEYVWKLQRRDSGTLFGAVESVAPNPGKLIRSLDGGNTWITTPAPESSIQAVGFVSETQGWMGGHDTGFYETTDAGASWTSTGVGSNLNRIFIVNDNLAYASGTTIYKMTNNMSVSEFEESARIPLQVRVAPNPIKDKLLIEVDFVGSDNMLLSLYSITGQLIKELKRDRIASAATLQYKFDFPYPQGTYILDLHTNTGRQSITIIK